MKKILLILLMSFTLSGFSQMLLLKSDTCPVLNSNDTVIISQYIINYEVSVVERAIYWYDVEKFERVTQDSTFIIWRNYTVELRDGETVPVGAANWTWLETLEWCTTVGVMGFPNANTYMLDLRGY